MFLGIFTSIQPDYLILLRVFWEISQKSLHKKTADSNNAIRHPLTTTATLMPGL